MLLMLRHSAPVDQRSRCWCWNFTINLSMFLFRAWILDIPSRELTYPPKNGILKMIFLFPRWDMLIPWRVDILTSFSKNDLQITFPSSIAATSSSSVRSKNATERTTSEGVVLQCCEKKNVGRLSEDAFLCFFLVVWVSKNQQKSETKKSIHVSWHFPTWRKSPPPASRPSAPCLEFPSIGATRFGAACVGRWILGSYPPSTARRPGWG